MGWKVEVWLRRAPATEWWPAWYEIDDETDAYEARQTAKARAIDDGYEVKYTGRCEPLEEDS